VNRKSIHSINVQVPVDWLLFQNVTDCIIVPTSVILCAVKIICDAANIISNVGGKWPGSVHNSRIYRESNLSNRLQRGKQPKDLHNINLPPLIHSNVSTIHYRRVWWPSAGVTHANVGCLPWPWTRPPTELQPGSLQDKSGDDHRHVESPFLVPTSRQGDPWEGLWYNCGMCCSS